MFAKCANPVCPVEFDYHRGGKYFRFHRDSGPAPAEDGEAKPDIRLPDVEHFWLCGRCSHAFTLVYVESRGVVLRPRIGGHLAAEPSREMTAA